MGYKILINPHFRTKFERARIQYAEKYHQTFLQNEAGTKQLLHFRFFQCYRNMTIYFSRFFFPGIIFLLLHATLQLKKLEVLAFSTNSFHLRRFLMQSLQLFILMLFRSFLTSSSHLFLRLPSDLADMGFPSYTIFIILSSGMRCTCPNQLIFVL